MKSFKTVVFAILLSALSLTQAQNKPEIFKDIPRPHVEPVIPHSQKVVVTPEQLKEVVISHNLIGKEITRDCFSHVKGQVCLDEILSYFGSEAEDNLEFIIIKENEKLPIPEVPYRVNIYLDKNNKIKSMKKA